MARYKVIYFNVATAPVYKIINSEMPEELELLTLSEDTDEARLKLLPEVDFILNADARLTAEHIAAAPKLKHIQHQGVGYDKTDVAAAAKRGIKIGLTPEGTSIGVAEHTILLILAVYKNLVVADTSLRQGNWRQWDLRPRSFEMCGKTLGLIGFGRIGQEVAKRAVSFETRVVFYDSYLNLGKADAEMWAGRGVESYGLEELLAESDILSLHIPANEETIGFLSTERLSMMKPSAIVINTARGKVVDEGALVEALQAGRLAGAGLDVFAEEPLPPGSPLCQMENVVLTPHISAGTVDALRQKMRAAFANIMRVVRGETPINTVD